MKLLKPKVTFFGQDNPLVGHFEVEPLERGVGTTIGTLLEGHMLKLYPVVRPSAFKFSHVKVDDVFCPIDGIEESGDEIMENLRKLLIVDDGCEGEAVASLTVKSNGTVLAGDLEVEGVKIVSPKLPLFTVKSNAKKIKFELLFNKRCGYYFIEDFAAESGYKRDFTYYNVNFTPISTVNFSVDNARVGRSINFDKLIFDLRVREGFSPQDLMQNAVENLQTFFERISDVIPEEVTELSMEKVETDRTNESLAISINDLELSIRCRNCLKQIDIKTLSDLTEKSIDELMEIKNFGKKSLDELREIMNRYGLKFKGET